jgi:hypothetical protein
MKPVFWITMAVTAVAALLATLIGIQTGVVDGSGVTSPADLGRYADACVVEVTHPELKIELYRTEAPADGCTFCRYWFRVWNQTAAVGTKAYETRVLVSQKPVALTALDGKTIQRLKLHGLVEELPPVTYPVIRDQEFFVVEGVCPDCLFPDQRFIALVMEYYECSGVRRFEAVCDLRCREVTVLRGSYEPTGGDCCR